MSTAISKYVMIYLLSIYKYVIPTFKDAFPIFDRSKVPLYGNLASTPLLMCEDKSENCNRRIKAKKKKK